MREREREREGEREREREREERVVDEMTSLSQIPPEAPWKAPHAKEWDQMTMQQFLDKHVWTK